MTKIKLENFWVHALVISISLVHGLNGQFMAMELGARCQHDMDCTDWIKGSACSMDGICECAPYFAQYNETTCLPSQLLGSDCVLAEQCSMKVANSSCLDGACRCVEGFLQFRKHTCLGPARPGTVCYSNAHCEMWDPRSHCDFLIPNLFGRCQCTSPARQFGETCVDKENDESVVVPGWEKPQQIASPEQDGHPESITEDGSVVIDTSTDQSDESILLTTTTRHDFTQTAISEAINLTGQDQDSVEHKIYAETTTQNSITPQINENENLQFHSNENLSTDDMEETHDHNFNFPTVSDDVQYNYEDEDHKQTEDEEIVLPHKETEQHHDPHPIEQASENNEQIDESQDHHIKEDESSNFIDVDEQAISELNDRTDQNLIKTHGNVDSFTEENSEEIHKNSVQGQYEDQWQTSTVENNMQETSSDSHYQHKEEEMVSAVLQDISEQDTERTNFTFKPVQESDNEIRDNQGSYLENSDESIKNESESSTQSEEVLSNEDHQEPYVPVTDNGAEQDEENNAISSESVTHTTNKIDVTFNDDNEISQTTNFLPNDSTTSATEKVTSNVDQEIESENGSVQTNEIKVDNEKTSEEEIIDSEDIQSTTSKQDNEDDRNSGTDSNEYNEKIMSTTSKQGIDMEDLGSQESDSNQDIASEISRPTTIKPDSESEGNMSEEDIEQIHSSTPKESMESEADSDENSSEEDKEKPVKIPQTIDTTTPKESLESEAESSEESNEEDVQKPEKVTQTTPAQQETESENVSSEESDEDGENGQAQTENNQIQSTSLKPVTKDSDESSNESVSDEDKINTVPPHSSEQHSQEDDSSESNEDPEGNSESVQESTSRQNTSSTIRIEENGTPTISSGNTEYQNTEASKAKTEITPQSDSHELNIVEVESTTGMAGLEESDTKFDNSEKPLQQEDKIEESILELDTETYPELALENSVDLEEATIVIPQMEKRWNISESTFAPLVEENFDNFDSKEQFTTFSTNSFTEGMDEEKPAKIPVADFSTDSVSTIPTVPLIHHSNAVEHIKKPQYEISHPTTDNIEYMDVTTDRFETETERLPIMEALSKTEFKEENLLETYHTSNSTPQPPPSKNEYAEVTTELHNTGFKLATTDISQEIPQFTLHPFSMKEEDISTTLNYDDLSVSTIITTTGPQQESKITQFPGLIFPNPSTEKPGEIADFKEAESNMFPIVVSSEKHQNMDLQTEKAAPDQLPFDFPSEVHRDTLHSDNLIIDRPQKFPVFYRTTTTAPGDILQTTTQTLLDLASRTTIMEPHAQISTTLANMITADTTTTSSSVSVTPARHEMLSKPTEIRKRVDLGDGSVSLGLPCESDKQCQLSDPYTYCNSRGRCDCAHQSDDTNKCSAQKTGCNPGTFQCRSSGVCISWFFVCDGRPDCNDSSDEECIYNVKYNQTCPSQSFRCARSGRCISRAALCDGKKQCPHGEDEMNCTSLKRGKCPPHTFRCKSGECLPEYEYCNAIISCKDGSDEPPHLCGSRSVPNFFLRLLTGPVGRVNTYCPHRCNNGRCRSTAIICSGRDGCGDGTDEETCSVCRCPAPVYEGSLLNAKLKRTILPIW